MKKKSKLALKGYCFRLEDYRRKMPEIEWFYPIRGVNRSGVVMEELKQPSTSFCIQPVYLRDLPLYFKNHGLLCLDPCFGEQELARYHPLAREACKIEGKLMALPEDFAPFTLFCRLDLIKKHGFKPAKDLAELAKQLRALSRKTGKPQFSIDGGGIYNRLGFLCSVLGAFGIDLKGRLEDWADQKDCLTQAYEWIRVIFNSNSISNLDYFIRQLSAHASRREFENGDLVYYAGWIQSAHLSWSEAFLERVNITPFPPAHSRAEVCTPLTGHGWIIPSNVITPAAAIKALKKMQNPEWIKSNEMKGGWPFIAWHALWNDPELRHRHPFYRWSSLFNHIGKAHLLTARDRKFELLDESFRSGLRENLKADRWLQMLLTREFSTSHKLMKSDVIKRALQYMEKNLATIHNLKQVAEHVQLSPKYFGHLFQSSMKMGCPAYLMQIRMEKARQLLKNRALSLKQIAPQLGFHHYTAFTRAFRKYWQKSPSEMSRNEP